VKILVIAAHADDAEVSVGGTIAKLTQAGHEVKVMVAIIPCEDIDGIVSEEEGKKRRSECKESAKILGTELEILDLDPYQMWFKRDLVKTLDGKIREFSPDVVFTHWDHDSHQDHVAIANATFAATRKNNACLLMYEQMLGGVTPYAFKGNVFVDISSVMELKMQSIEAYHSQIARYGNWLEAIIGRAAFRGHQIGVRYAETFEAVNMFFDIREEGILIRKL